MYKNLNKSEIITIEKYNQNPNKQNNSRFNKTTRFYKLKESQKQFSNHRPQIGQQQLKQIYKKINLENEVKKLTRQRFKNNNYFVNYGFNSFSLMKKISDDRSNHDKSNHNKSRQNRLGYEKLSYDKSKSKSTKYFDKKMAKSPLKSTKTFNQEKQISKNKITQNLSIVQGIDNMKNKKLNRKDQFKKNRIQTQSFSQSIISLINQKRSIKQYQKASQNPIFSQQLVKPREMSIDEIVDMKDNNFFMSNQKQINLFKVLYAKDINQFKDNSLAKYNFCFSSGMEKIRKTKINIQRDLSKFRRTLYQNPLKSFQTQRLQLLNSQESNINLDYMVFKDFIHIPSSIITPQIANILIFGKKQSDQNQQSIDQNHLKDIHNNHVSMNYKAQNIQQQEIKIYLNLQPIKEELQYRKKCKVLVDDIKQNVQRRKRLVGNQVKDIIVHENLSSKVHQRFYYLLNLDSKMSTKKQRFSNYEFGNLRLKTKHLLQALQYKKKEQKSYSHLMSNTSRH